MPDKTDTTMNNIQAGDLRSPEPPKNGKSDRSPVQTPLRPPTLKEAVAALPHADGGDLTRQGLGPLVDRRDMRAILSRAVDEISSVRGLVEVLRCAATETDAPIADTLAGIDALADLVRERLRRLQSVLQGIAGEMKAPGEMKSP